MKEILLVAWLETEGSIAINVRESNPRLEIQISQKYSEPLEKLKKYLGFGEITKAGANYILRFRTIIDIEKLFELLDRVSKDFWLTKKFEKFKLAKEFWNWRKKRNKHQRYSESEILYLNNIIHRISPKAKDLKAKTFTGMNKELVREKLNNLRKTGKGHKEIERELKIGRGTLYNWYHILGIPLRGTNSKPRSLKIENIFH